MSTWNPNPPGSPEGPPPGFEPTGSMPPPYGPPSGADVPPYSAPPSAGGIVPPYGPPPGAPPYGGPGGPPLGGPPGRGPRPRLNPGLIAGVVMVVVIAGGLIVYFGFLNKSTAASSNCSSSLSSPSQCSSVTTTTIPFKPVGSTTTTIAVPTTSTTAPSPVTTIPTPETTPGTGPTTSTPGPTNGTCQNVTFGASITLTVACSDGWSVQSTGQETTLADSKVSTATMDVWVQQSQNSTIQTVLQTDMTFFQQQISNFQTPSTNLTVQTLSGTHFQQGLATPFSGTLSGSQGTEQITGEVYILFSPSSQVSARVIAFASSQAEYTAISQQVLTMTQSMF